MTSANKELFRHAILRVLDANRTRYGLSIPAVAHLLPMYAFSAANFKGDDEAFRDAVGDEIQYFTNKGLVEEALKIISKENRAFRITDKGIAFVDSQL